MFKTDIEALEKKKNKNLKYAVRFMYLAVLAALPTCYHIISGQPFPMEKTWYTQGLTWANNILNVFTFIYFYKAYRDMRKIEVLKTVEQYQEKYHKEVAELPQSDKEIFLFYRPEKEKEL